MEKENDAGTSNIFYTTGFSGESFVLIIVIDTRQDCYTDVSNN